MANEVRTGAPVNTKSLAAFLFNEMERLKAKETTPQEAIAQAKLASQLNNLLDYELKRTVVQVKLEISSDQRMTLYGEDFDFSTEANDRIGIDYSGAKDMTLGVKADSIIDELSRIIEPTVTIHFTDPSRAVTITPDDPLYQNEEITMLLMPMLVNE